jgi:hypothetical protein
MTDLALNDTHDLIVLLQSQNDFAHSDNLASICTSLERFYRIKDISGWLGQHKRS